MESVLLSHEGVAPRRAFIDAGHTSYDIGRARHSGAIFRVRRGWYASVRADPAVVASVRVGGALTCVSALARAGVWVRADDRVHVAVPANASRLRSVASARVTRQDDRAGAVIHWRNGAGSIAHPVQSIATALNHAVLCQSPELALVAIDCALNRELVRLPQLQAAFDTVLARRLLQASDSGSQSGLETMARWRLRSLKLRVRTQVEIAGVGRVDVMIGDRLVLELDGYGFHATGEFFESDRRRDLALSALGYRTVRLSYRQVMHEWDSAEQAILTMIRRGDHLWPRTRR